MTNATHPAHAAQHREADLAGMSQPVDVLVVCEGNLCRSPLAERLFRLRTPASRARASSAGLNAVVGDPMDPLAADELVRLGGDPTDFAARQFKSQMASDAHVILTASRAIRSQVVQLAPFALKRTFTLRELAALLEDPPWSGPKASFRATLAKAADWRASASGLGDDLDVRDPIGRSPKVHRESADLIDRATQVIADRLK